MRNVDTFFHGHRRESFIDGVTILRNAAGEKRLKLSMRIPLVGDQLVGLPTWADEPFSVIAKPQNAVKPISWAQMELDPMVLTIFALPDDNVLAKDQESINVFEGVRLCSFKIGRDGNGSTEKKEYPDVVLTFSAYLPRTGRFLEFADTYFGTSLFIQYDAAQQQLLDMDPNTQPSDPPRDLAKYEGGGDDFEDGGETEDETIPSETTSERALGKPGRTKVTPMVVVPAKNVPTYS